MSDADVSCSSPHARAVVTTAGGPCSCSSEQGAVSTPATSSFEQLCNDGSQWTRRNWMVKVARWPLTLLRQTYLIWMCFSVPTNFLMLTCRTYLRDFNKPDSNSDDLAALFRDELMPVRGRLHRNKSPLVRFGMALIETPFLGVPGTVQLINTRTQWFDDGVRAALKGGIKQVVVIAAGYDTRAYRFGKPGVRFYEVDLPHASKRKQDLVHKLLPADKAQGVEYVAADLSKVKLADALASTSFDPTAPTLFTIEGLMYYLPPGAVKQLFSSIADVSATGSRLMFDFVHLSSFSGATWHPGCEVCVIALGNKGERWKSCIDERPKAMQRLMGLFGFDAAAVLTSSDLIKRYLPGSKHEHSAVPVVPPYFGFVSADKR